MIIRILFVVTYLNTGGIVRSLQSFLNQYNTKLYDIDVFAMVHQGLFVGGLNNCTLLPRCSLIHNSVNQYRNQKGWAKIISILLKISDKLSGYRFQAFLFRWKGRNLLKKKPYDVVIGFSEGLPTKFVSLMNHHNKIGWIHCDYASYLKVSGINNESNTYQKLQSIVCVSEYTRKSFIKVYPTFENKTCVIYNLINEKYIKQKAEESFLESFGKSAFTIVSVGRIDPVKRLSIIPEIAKRVIDAGKDIQWYVIGPKGTEEEFNKLRNNIKKYGVEGIIILLGEKANPYPYIANSDLLVNTSISEACPYVINEAKMLGIPVICTDFGSAPEFISNGVNGYYEPIELIADRIIWLFNHTEKQLEIRNNLRSFVYDNDKQLTKIYSLF